MLQIVMDWRTAEMLGAIWPHNVNDHRAFLRGGSHWLIRTRESMPMFWPNQLDASELAGLMRRSSEP